jgi:hypothetical protein
MNTKYSPIVTQPDEKNPRERGDQIRRMTEDSTSGRGKGGVCAKLLLTDSHDQRRGGVGS